MVITYLLFLLFSMNFMLCGKYFLSAMFVYFDQVAFGVGHVAGALVLYD